MTTIPSLTRRGHVVLLVVVLGFAMGHLFGGRNLNAVVVPAGALLLATGAYVATISTVEIERDAPSYGHQGDERALRHKLSSNRRVPARITDKHDDGIDGDTVTHTTTNGEWTETTITLHDRGVHTIGPAQVDVTDPLGLWTTALYDQRTHRVTVYPRVHPLGHTASLLEGYIGVTNEREHFDGVREYRPGDPLRDVNWKASAKQPGGLAVTEYAGEGSSNHVTVVAEAIGPRADGVAEATASIVAHLLDNGLAVELVTTDTTLPAGNGDPHRRSVLETLARLDRGRVRRRHRDSADILVAAPETGEHVEVTIGTDSRRYAELVDTGQGVRA